MERGFDLVETIVALHDDKDWRKIIEYHDARDANKLLWVFPSEENVRFFGEVLSQHGIDSLLSIGSGSALLEWILHQALGVKVTCVEVDDGWWKCKYAPPTFLPLHFAESSLEADTATRVLLANADAIVFCYFNNRRGFVDYLSHFEGRLLVVVGPGDDSHVHADPTPFDVRLPDCWTLIAFQRVRSSHDYIAFYCKTI